MKHLKWVILTVLFFSIHNYSWTQSEKDIKVKTDYGKLYGTLITCENKRDAPIVIIIPGSGPTDRNGNSVLAQTNSYKLLAEDLADQGISSLRYDKLLVGESKGNINEEELRFDDNVAFVSAWIDYLNSKRYNNIVLLGHSEGSLIGMLAAQENNVSKFISIAGTGRSIDKVLIDQLSEQPAPIQSEVKKLFQKMREGKPVNDVSSELSGLFRPSVQPYIRSWMKYEPKDEIGKLNIPVFIIHGTTDIQVKKKDAELQYGGNSKAELKYIEGMNHIFKEATEDKEANLKTYYNPKLPLHPELIPAIVGFVK